jgi:hypothetical protein
MATSKNNVVTFGLSGKIGDMLVFRQMGGRTIVSSAPDIEQVDLSGYTGKVGDRILVQASDDFAVKSVHVHIANADGSLVEKGEAEHAGILWAYTATQNNESLEGDKIIISASDLPGNVTEEYHGL